MTVPPRAGSAPIVVRAAAGCGKTTDLARRYLSFLADGVPAEQAIAITFTRKAAAELVERVSLALWACLGGPQAAAARARLGAVWSHYEAVAPRDPAVVRAALAALPEAPIGTTDAFVGQLLTEFALDVALPLPGGGRVPLDLPIMPGAGVQRALDRTARRILDPPDGTLDPDVALLVRYLPLDRLLVEVSRRTDIDDLPLASASEVLGTAARWMAEALAPLDLAEIYAVARPGDLAAWTEALVRGTQRPGLWAVPAVAAWLADGGHPDEAPSALCGWLQGLQHRGRRPLLRQALESAIRPLGPAELSLWQIVGALQHPYDDPSHVSLADALRAARWRLRQRVLVRGLEQAALAGELGYDELLESAIDLCEARPERLRSRYRALLVDEVQDADPRQLRLYRALANLGDVHGYFVGDARQSIYLFRGAEPDGMRRLEEQGRAEGHEPIDLSVNRRSAPRLVLAQRALFRAAEGPMSALRWRPLASLATLEPDPSNAPLALDPALHHPDDPVWIVHPEIPSGRVSDDDLDDRALRVFVARLAAARSEPGHADDSAAVLAPNWAIAQRASRRIREWARRADAAFVEGSSRRGSERVADDLRLWLRALLDRSDDAAWLAIWKHPSVGLSDAALARIAAGVGLVAAAGADVPGWWSRLGRVVEAEALAEPHDPIDILAFARARDPLRAAADQLGRTSTSTVLDRVTAELGWRTVLSAGPGGPDEIAELEVLMDWIRGHDTDGRPADEILDLFDDEHAEKPHVHVERPPGHVACTTVFQAKGRAWDHVCVLRPGRHSRVAPTRDHDDGWMILDGRRVRLEGLKLDPRGGLSAFPDPLGRLAAQLHAVRYTEEAARLAYVAITRARRSVTFALAPQAGPRRGPDEPRLPEVLAAAWLAPDAVLPGVARIGCGPVPPPGPPPVGWARPTGAALPVSRPPIRSWEERAPSSVGAHLDAEARARLSASFLERIRHADGLHLGAGSLPPPGTDPLTGRGLPGHALGHVRPLDWGHLMHGWFACWQFRGEPDPLAIARYLEEEWGGAPPEVCSWIDRVCRQLARVGGPVWSRVVDPDSRLWFEHPLLGLGQQQDREVLLSGRMDLVIDHPSGRTTVVDFKAGAGGPSGWDTLSQSASVRRYAFQLHAYADALRRMGRTVDTVALWFVRSGTSVRWTP